MPIELLTAINEGVGQQLGICKKKKKNIVVVAVTDFVSHDAGIT